MMLVGGLTATILGAGALAVPAMAAHRDSTGAYQPDCASPTPPPYDGAGSKTVSGWSVYGGPATGSSWVGAHSNDPYYMANVDTTNKSVTVEAWQSYRDEGTIGPPAAGVKGPMYVDASASVSASGGVTTCNGSILPHR